MRVEVNNSAIELVEADITEMAVDAIVNAANAQLVLGGGVAGAIRKKGGNGIQAECSRLAPIEVGQAVITSAGRLKARYVIHAAGPRMRSRDAEVKLRNATLNSLKVADENSVKSIAIPAISTGIFGFPLDKCADLMLNAAFEYLKGETSIERVIFTLYDEDALSIFTAALRKIRH